MSSFQLALTTDAFAPDVAVLLNVAEDHLDWHGSFDAYAAAKGRVFAHQGAAALLVVNRDDPVADGLAAAAPGRRGPLRAPARRGAGDYGVRDGALVGPAGGGGPGPAVGCTARRRQRARRGRGRALDLGADAAAVRHGPGRLRRPPPPGAAGGRARRRAVTSTTPRPRTRTPPPARWPASSTWCSSPGPQQGARPRQPARAGHRVRAVVAIGEAADEVEAAFAGAVPVVRADSMREAVRAAPSAPQPGDVVLLSPACASFDWYESYAARGDDFAREVELLAETSPRCANGGAA